MSVQQVSEPTIAHALKAAARTPGWSARPKDVQTFALGAGTLYVVPARRWINRRDEVRESSTQRVRWTG